MFHLNRVGNGNDDISLEEHFKKFVTRTALIFVQIFEFYLVTQSL